MTQFDRKPQNPRYEFDKMHFEINSPHYKKNADKNPSNKKLIALQGINNT